MAEKRILKRAAKRTPLAERNLIKAESKKGFIRRWVNDTPGRVQDMVNAGYDLVPSDESKMKQDASLSLDDGTWKTRSMGGGHKAFLMEVPEEIFFEDQRLKEEKVRGTENSLMEDIKDMSGVYGEGITVDSGRKTSKSGRPMVTTI